MRKSRPNSAFRYTPVLSRSQPDDPSLIHLAIETLCNAFPSGAMVLDAKCRVLFSNREALNLVARWAGSRIAWKAPRPHCCAVPAEFVAACERLKHGAAAGESPRSRPRFGGRVFLRHPRNRHLSAVVALERSPRDRRVAVFCILLQDGLTDSLVGGRKDQLAMLTIAERRVAKLVAEGLRNGEIAKTLGKSVTTVKTQLSATYAKLEIRTRTQLATLLRAV